MKSRVVLTIPSDPKYLCVAREVTAKMGLVSGMDEDERERLKLAVDEACANVIRHVYQGRTENKITVTYGMTADALEVTIDDEGPKVDSARIEGRDLDDVRPGGLGIHFIKRVFDVFEFEAGRKKGNRLKLVRYLKR